MFYPGEGSRTIRIPDARLFCGTCIPFFRRAAKCQVGEINNEESAMSFPFIMLHVPRLGDVGGKTDYISVSPKYFLKGLSR